MDDYLEKSDKLRDEMAELQAKMEALQTKRDKVIPNCPVCQDKVMLPVRLVSNDGEYCPYSEKNPLCLLCTRTWMKHYGKGNIVDCMGRCCKVRINGYRTYGQIGRSSADIPEEEWWTKLGTVGVTKCRKCDIECNTILELHHHIRHKCIHRNIYCQLCKNTIPYLEMDRHVCHGRCRRCGEEDIKVNKETGEIIHYCPNLIQVKCEFCNERLDIDKLSEHQCPGNLAHSDDIIRPRIFRGRGGRGFGQGGRGFGQGGRGFGQGGRRFDQVDDEILWGEIMDQWNAEAAAQELPLEVDGH